jgi:hypothetical protein
MTGWTDRVGVRWPVTGAADGLMRAQVGAQGQFQSLWLDEALAEVIIWVGAMPAADAAGQCIG